MPRHSLVGRKACQGGRMQATASLNYNIHFQVIDEFSCYVVHLWKDNEVNGTIYVRVVPEVKFKENNYSYGLE